MKSRTVAIAAVVVAGAVLWLAPGRRAPEPSPSPVAVAPPPPVAPAASAAAAGDGPRYPVEEPALPLGAGDVRGALTELLGRGAVATLVLADDFPRRFVATVDNLGRAHAPPVLWPVTPTAGRFAVRQTDGTSVIAADNAARYTPFVLLAESVDSARAVALYQRMYPLLQQAYRELGFPNGRFNDRLVEVIDQLLATPVFEAPPAVQLVEVKGPVASTRPWVRYEFRDTRLESLSAGQKMLLRSGPVNQRRLQAKLAQLRSALTASGGR